MLGRKKARDGISGWRQYERFDDGASSSFGEGSGVGGYICIVVNTSWIMES